MVARRSFQAALVHRETVDTDSVPRVPELYFNFAFSCRWKLSKIVPKQVRVELESGYSLRRRSKVVQSLVDLS